MTCQVRVEKTAGLSVEGDMYIGSDLFLAVFPSDGFHSS